MLLAVLNQHLSRSQNIHLKSFRWREESIPRHLSEYSECHLCAAPLERQNNQLAIDTPRVRQFKVICNVFVQLLDRQAVKNHPYKITFNFVLKSLAMLLNSILIMLALNEIETILFCHSSQRTIEISWRLHFLPISGDFLN